MMRDSLPRCLRRFEGAVNVTHVPNGEVRTGTCARARLQVRCALNRQRRGPTRSHQLFVSAHLIAEVQHLSPQHVGAAKPPQARRPYGHAA